MLKKVAHELMSTDPGEVVKVASLAGKLWNWISKSWNSPQYKEHVENVKEESVELVGALKELSDELLILQSAINAVDVAKYTQSLVKIRMLIKNVMSDLEILEENAELAVSPRKFIKFVSPGFEKDPEILAQLKKQLPQDIDIPVGEGFVNKPLKSFKHFENVTPENVVITDKVYEDFIMKAYTLISNNFEVEQSYKEDLYKLLSKVYKSDIERALQRAILNGTIIEYEHAPVRKGANYQIANQMKLVVNAGIITLPGTKLKISIPSAVLIDDRFATLSTHRLVLIRVSNLKLAGGSLTKKEELTSTSFFNQVQSGLVKNAIAENRVYFKMLGPKAELQSYASALSNAIKLGLETTPVLYWDKDDLILENRSHNSKRVLADATYAMADIVKEEMKLPIFIDEVEDINITAAFSQADYLKGFRKIAMEKL